MVATGSSRAAHLCPLGPVNFNLLTTNFSLSTYIKPCIHIQTQKLLDAKK